MTDPVLGYSRWIAKMLEITKALASNSFREFQKLGSQRTSR